MVKSPSCFKIITCGSDSAEKDDLEVTEGKSSSDKRGWSFGKRSARHRVLSNTVTTETPTIKEGPQSGTVNFDTQSNTTVPEKISAVLCDDEKKPQLATFLKTEELNKVVKEEAPDTAVKIEEPDTVVKKELPELPEAVVKEELPEAVVKEELPEVVVKEELPEAAVKEELPEAAVTEELPEELSAVVTVESEIDESAVIVIQIAFRGFLARKELLKLKKVVKLQAAVRGHIVRRHAVGTLRCVQAIVKMQSLVRARRARLSLDGSRQISYTKEEDNLVKKSSGLNSSIEKLLGNKFARQMLESTPKTKPIHVKCDPSNPDSAWKWLERWMSVSSVSSVESNKEGLVTEELEKEKEVKFEPLTETKIEPEIICESVDSKCSSVHESVAPSESEDNLITYEADKFDFQPRHFTNSSVRDDLEQLEFENTSTSDLRETSVDINSVPNKDIQSHVDSQIELRAALYGEPEAESEQPKLVSTEILASEELETEGNKLVCGSKKASSSSFREAQSKFEELSSAVSSGQTMSSSYREVADESRHDTIPSEAQSVITTKETSVTESPVHGSRIQVGGSECGTELSVTSTLDSPDRSDVGVTEHEPEPEPNASEEVIIDPNVQENLHTIPDQNEKLDSVAPVVVSMDSPTRENKSETYVQGQVASPEASPSSHMTVPESQGTPSSQVSVNDGKKKSGKTGSGKKRLSLSAAIKKSPPKPNYHESGPRRSVEKQPREQKNGKRRSSFGSPKPENGEEEARDSSGSASNSLPHFMQATESARAKLNNPSNSPRSSPDVQDGDNYLKKRHSLPAADGRQGSPRIQRSTSQAQPKGNERKWQR